jgi:hypothetical protein
MLEYPSSRPDYRYRPEYLHHHGSASSIYLQLRHEPFGLGLGNLFGAVLGKSTTLISNEDRAEF